MSLKPFAPISHDSSVLFDAIRSASAACVLAGHSYQIFVKPSFDHPVVTRAFYVLAGYSVMIFFAISGYMIALSIYRNLSGHGFKHFDLRGYLRDRLLRLYPPLILSLAISIAVIGWAATFWSQDGELGWMAQVQPSILASLFFLQNMFEGALPTPDINFPLWSLAFEFWFYILAGLVVAAIVNRQIWFGVLALALLASIAAFGLPEDFFPGLVVWVSGFIAAALMQNLDLRSSRARIVLVSALLAAATLWAGSVLRLVPSLWEAKFNFGVLFALAMLVVLSSFSAFVTKLSGAKVIKLFALGAPFSFTLYVIHYPLMNLLYGLGRDLIRGNLLLSAFAGLASFIAMLVLASWLARFVEDRGRAKHVLSLMRRRREPA